MTAKFGFGQFVRIIFRQPQFNRGCELLRYKIGVSVHVPTRTRKPVVECVQRFRVAAVKKGQKMFANLADGNHDR